MPSAGLRRQARRSSPGEAGPVHAYGIADPRPPGVSIRRRWLVSAIGFLVAPMSFGLRSTAAACAASLVGGARHGGAGDEWCRDGGARAIGEPVVHQHSVDMRYQKQGFEVRVPLPEGALDAAAVDVIRASFGGVYRRLYGHRSR